MNFGIIINTVSIFWVASEIILNRMKRSHSADTRLDKYSLPLIWGIIAIAVTFGILISAKQIGYFGNGSRIYPTAGLILIVCGLLIRWFAILSLKYQFTVDVSIAKDHRIIRKGIYRFVRHPSYSGSLLSFFGLGLSFANYLSILVIFLPICSAFLYRIRVEEKALIDNFGDEYINYCASTKRLIPGIY